MTVSLLQEPSKQDLYFDLLTNDGYAVHMLPDQRYIVSKGGQQLYVQLEPKKDSGLCMIYASEIFHASTYLSPMAVSKWSDPRRDLTDRNFVETYFDGTISFSALRYAKFEKSKLLESTESVFSTLAEVQAVLPKGWQRILDLHQNRKCLVSDDLVVEKLNRKNIEILVDHWEWKPKFGLGGGSGGWIVPATIEGVNMFLGQWASPEPDQGLSLTVRIMLPEERDTRWLEEFKRDLPEGWSARLYSKMLDVERTLIIAKPRSLASIKSEIVAYAKHLKQIREQLGGRS